MFKHISAWLHNPNQTATQKTFAHLSVAVMMGAMIAADVAAAVVSATR
jgi:hypothetical protein